jgi:hypothetical protein
VLFIVEMKVVAVGDLGRVTKVRMDELQHLGQTALVTRIEPDVLDAEIARARGRAIDLGLLARADLEMERQPQLLVPPAECVPLIASQAPHGAAAAVVNVEAQTGESVRVGKIEEIARRHRAVV